MLEGLLFGLLIFVSTLISWTHLPQWIKTFTIRHFIISELVFTITTYITVTSISKSLVAVVAAATAGLLANLSVVVYRSIYDGS